VYLRVIVGYLSRKSGLVKLPKRALSEVQAFVEESLTDRTFTSGERKKQFTIYPKELEYTNVSFKYNALTDGEFRFDCVVYTEPVLDNARGYQEYKSIYILKQKYITPQTTWQAINSTVPHELIHLLQQFTITPIPARAKENDDFMPQGQGGKYKIEPGFTDYGDSYFTSDIEYEPQILSLARLCIQYVKERIVSRKHVGILIREFFRKSDFLQALKKAKDQTRYRNAYKKAAAEVMRHFENFQEPTLEDLARRGALNYTDIISGAISADDPTLKKALLIDIELRPSNVTTYLERRWLSPDDHGVQDALKETLRDAPEWEDTFLKYDWMSFEDIMRVLEEQRSKYGL
jgi:hypothetical protein